MKKIIVLMLALTHGWIVNAQNANEETIQWNATGFRDLVTNVDFTNSSQFITNGQSTIKWIQDNGKSVSILNVTSTLGTWPDINNEGSIKYKFTDGRLSGELKLSKDGSQWVAEFTIVGGTDDIRLRYSISSVKKI